ncbi:hypothetical protein CK203_087879 [Vitis vinifera]|uniref:Reverse transcriptase zinc-binding domain-containing protein n=1 Tax=Vitis vinifera TaxID=29760 RepID=A0A438DQT3_VITVI|nr:hypothetical protein CK203_087879 [Vitis vinifera]
MGMEVLSVLIRRAVEGGFVSGVASSEVLVVKYGQEDLGWRTKKANGALGVGVWKEILKEFVCAVPKILTSLCYGCIRMPQWKRCNLLLVLRGHRITLEEDSVFWKEGRNRQFRVKKAYSLLVSPIAAVFPKSNIWVDRVPTKFAFFAWEAAWEKVLTLDRLQKRG